VVTVTAVLAACSAAGDEASPSSVATPDDAATALTVCTALRGTDNAIVDIVNESVAGIGGLPPGDRRDGITAGMNDVSTELDGWDARIDDLPLPPDDEGDELRRQLRVGVDAARAELADQRAEFEAASGPVPDEEVAGVVGTWFNTVEKIVSSLEPEIFTFERREFKQAFLDEPDCRNVIQQFVND
jgi:hypothetical protein